MKVTLGLLGLDFQRADQRISLHSSSKSDKCDVLETIIQVLYGSPRGEAMASISFPRRRAPDLYPSKLHHARTTCLKQDFFYNCRGYKPSRSYLVLTLPDSSLTLSSIAEGPLAM